MKNLFVNLSKDKHSLALSILLILFIVFNIELPLVLADLVDNIVSKVTLIVVCLILLSSNKLLGVLAFIAVYVLIQRAEMVSGTGPLNKYVPNQVKRTNEIFSYNKFPVTVEEEVIHNILPLTVNDAIMPPSYDSSKTNIKQATNV